MSSHVRLIRPGYQIGFDQVAQLGGMSDGEIGPALQEAIPEIDREIVSRCITGNLLERLMKPLFH